MNILAEDFTEKRIETLYRELRRERQLRKEAEANASRFHALLLAERIKHLPARPADSRYTASHDVRLP